MCFAIPLYNLVSLFSLFHVTDVLYLNRIGMGVSKSGVKGNQQEQREQGRKDEKNDS